MELILAVIVVLGVLGFIAYPLFNTPPEERTETPVALDGLLSQRDAAYEALRDLDFDFQMGKLSQSDYTTMRERYKGRAAVALEQIDETNRLSAGAQAEEQIAKLRAAKQAAPPADDAIEREIARLRAGKHAPAGLRCGKCGTPYAAGDTYCAKCGNRLTTKLANS
ncbi:MAG TPA: hypothetical protein VF478_09700 [Anaerolineae bacterium]